MKFQFHKGTIRTGIFLFFGQEHHTFQFHKGTIRTHTGATNSDAFKISIP